MARLQLTEEEIEQVIERMPSWSRSWPAGSVRLVLVAFFHELEQCGWQLHRRPDLQNESRPACPTVGQAGEVLALGRRR